MPRDPRDEREYFLRRAADHGLQADRCAEIGHRELHQRFETIYRERADAIVVQED